MFDKATRLKLRFQSDKHGLVSTEDLWDISMAELNRMAKALNRKRKQNEEEDFLAETTKEDQLTKLQFDLVLHVLSVKKQESEEARSAKARKELKDKYLEVLSRKQDAALENLSEADLLAKINEL